MPGDLKSAKVVPLLKMNNKTEVVNYRPVSILRIHYENMPIQIYRRFHLQKLKNFQIKTPIFFVFLLKTSIVGTR